MECDEVRELLDAYALGALEGEEAAGLEEHVAECARCWDQLTEAQQVTAKLALGLSPEKASPALRDRVLAAARKAPPGKPAAVGIGISRFRRAWPIGAGALAAGAVAGVVLSAVLLTQVNDLRSDNEELQGQVATASEVMNQLRQVEAVRSAPDVQSVQLPSTPDSSEPEALATYYWSKTTGTGALIGNNLKTLEPGQVYYIWLFVDGEAIFAGTFYSWQGVGHQVIDLAEITSRKPTALGVSIESGKEAEEPAGDMILWTAFPGGE